MDRRAPLVLLVLTACAPAAAPPPSSSGPPRINTSAGGTDIYIEADRSGSTTTASAPVERVWTTLPEVYSSLGISGAVVDPAARVYGNPRLVVMRRLAGERLSTFFRCGETATGSPIADAYRLRISVLTTLSPASAGETRVQTRASATAQSVEGASAAPVQCASTGILEQRIGEMITRRATA
ncbi:MAG TPA: hypothetical protein VHG28_07645 [Longimicrobiaceae bacterium]|nr:hypothetical protein [Longimicrobiaceae bacterium]